MEETMDEPENKRLKCEEEEYSEESLHLLNIFPDLIWRLILDKLNNSAEYFKLCQSFPKSHNLFSVYRTKILFDDVIKIMVQRLEDRQEQDVQLPDLVCLRRICKTWKRGVDSNLQNLSLNYKFSTEYKLPRSQFEKDLDSKYGYRFLQVDDYEEFLSHFDSSHGTTDVNPFITRRIIISVLVNSALPLQPQLDSLESSCLDVLRKFGKHVWYLHFEAGVSPFFYSPNRYPLFTLLKKILHHLPNLRVLRIDPSLNLRVTHEVNRFPELGNPDNVPLISGVRTLEIHDETGQDPDCRPEPRVIPRPHFFGMAQHRFPINFFQIFGANPPAQPGQVVQVPANPAAQPGPVIPVPANPLGQFGQLARVPRNIAARAGPFLHAAVNLPLPARVGAVGPANPPLMGPVVLGRPEPNDLYQVPVLPHLRFVDQGKLPFVNFLQIIRPNVQSLTQVGVRFTSNEECMEFFKLPLKLKKLEINFSELGMPWFEIFPLLENSFGESLENLHISLLKPVIASHLRLPKLKVLHLVLDAPVPLDFLLGMSYTLEELYLKVGEMTLAESAQVQEEERRVVLYKHLGQLTSSNIWTEFPKLRKVRVSSHVEIENMTPVWQCTVEEWKTQRNKI